MSPDVLAQVAEGFDHVADALTEVTRVTVNPYVRAPLLALRKVVADLRLAARPA